LTTSAGPRTPLGMVQESYPLYCGVSLVCTVKRHIVKRINFCEDKWVSRFLHHNISQNLTFYLQFFCGDPMNISRRACGRHIETNFRIFGSMDICVRSHVYLNARRKWKKITLSLVKSTYLSEKFHTPQSPASSSQSFGSFPSPGL